MKGLLLKDLYMAAKYCRAFLVIVAIFLAISFFGEDNIFFIIYPTMIAGIIPMTLISYDERDKWMLYSGTLPYSKAQLVSVKYLIGLIFGGSTLLVSMAAAAVRMQLNGYFSLSELFATGAALLVLGLIGPTLLLPFVFKFGAEKGRIAFYLMMGIICAIAAILAGLGFQTILLMNQPGVLGLICGGAILLYILSWRLSILFYRKREL